MLLCVFADSLQQLAVVEILAETSDLLLQASFFREAARCLGATRDFLATVVRHLKAAGDAAGANFLRAEAIAWSQRLVARCPPDWSQTAALQLVLQELEKAT